MSDKKPDATNQGPVLKIRNGTDFATADVYFRGRHVFEIGRLSQRNDHGLRPTRLQHLGRTDASRF